MELKDAVLTRNRIPEGAIEIHNTRNIFPKIENAALTEERGEYSEREPHRESGYLRWSLEFQKSASIGIAIVSG